MKIRKGLFIVSGACILAGVVICGVAVAHGGLQNPKTERCEKKITTDISKVDISTKMGDITVVSSDIDYINIVYFSSEKRTYTISDYNDTLSVKSDCSNMKWYDYIGFGSQNKNDIILEVPNNFNSDIVLETKLGDIKVSGIAGNIDVTTSYGDIKVTNCSKSNVICRNKCGDIELDNISGSVNAECKKGDIEFENISGDIIMKNNFGDIEGTIFGNEEDYTINAKTSLGDNNLNDKTGGKNKLEVKNDCGDINVKFIK